MCFKYNKSVNQFRKMLELLSHPVVHCFVDERISTTEEALMHMEEANPEHDFAVCLKGDDKFIGTLFGRKDDEDTFSPCCNFLADSCGYGYATEAAKGYFDYLFNKIGMRRLYAFTESDNLASQNVCRKLGMRHEGTFKEFISFIKNPDNTPLYEDTLQFAIFELPPIKHHKNI